MKPRRLFLPLLSALMLWPALQCSDDSSDRSALPSAAAGVDVREDRRDLPDTRILPGLLGESRGGTERRFRSFETDARQFETWTRSHGDDFSSKYSTLDQIDRTNVGRLEVAWTFDSAKATAAGGGDRHTVVQANPIVVGRTLFAATAQDTLVALDAVTGVLRWEVAPDARPAHRGLLHWPGDADTSARLYLPVGEAMWALDPGTGRPDPGFGGRGRVRIGPSTTAPAVVGERLIVTVNKPAGILALDVRDGASLWRTPLTEYDDPLAGGAAWGGFSVDPQRQVAYVTTGNPKPALFGGSRPGDNPHSNSLVAVDLRSGEILWSWQEVAHDLWNMDIAAPPVLTTLHLEPDGRAVDVVAAATKLGNTLLLERDSGEPLFDYRLRKAPVSGAAGERTAAYQPDLELPEPFASATFGPDDVTDIGEANRASVLWQLEGARHGFFLPAVMGRSVISFGLHGGAEWPGVAVDHETGWMFVPINRMPWKIRLYILSRQAEPPALEGRDLYLARCSSCHGTDRGGRYGEIGEADDDWVPSLVALTGGGFEDVFEADHFERRHRNTAVGEVAQVDLDLVQRFCAEWDARLNASSGFRIASAASHLLDEEGYAGSKPPWGEVVAIDLGSGRIRWRVPFGEYDALTQRGIPRTGQANYGGLIATRGGLLFATGTVDGRIRALDSSSGDELWSQPLPAAGSAPPLTYQVDGTQYVAVVSTGGRYHQFVEKASQIIAFRLGRPPD